MKGNFEVFLQNIWRFLWQVSAFGILHLATVLQNIIDIIRFFGKYWYVIYLEYIWITSCEGLVINFSCHQVEPESAWKLKQFIAILM